VENRGLVETVNKFENVSRGLGDCNYMADKELSGFSTFPPAYYYYCYLYI
jgi:hypothetical protein